jgi:type IV secretion system protein VirB1
MWIAQLSACARTVAPVTMRQVVMVESGGKPLALKVNGLAAALQPRPRTTAEAVAVAQYWTGHGDRVDLGLTQIDSENLPALHLTIDQVLGTDPVTVCANLRAGAAILTADYGRAVQRYQAGQPALAAALSAYNTGDFGRGFSNGYVGRYYAILALMLPSSDAPETAVARAAANKHAVDIEVW